MTFVTFCINRIGTEGLEGHEEFKEGKGCKEERRVGERCLSSDSPSRVVRPGNTPDSESQATEGKEVKEYARIWPVVLVSKVGTPACLFY